MLLRMMTKSILWRLLFNAGVSFSTGFEALSFDTISIWLNDMFLSIIDDAFPHDDKIHSLTVAFQCWCAFFPCLWGAFVWYHFDLTLWLCFYLSLKVFFRRMTTKSILWRLLFNAGVSFSTGFDMLSFDTFSIWLNGYVSIYHWRCFSACWQNPFFDGCFSMLVCVFTLSLGRFRLIPFRSDLMVVSIYNWRCFSAWWQNPFFDSCFSMLVWVFPLAWRRFRLIPFRSDLMICFYLSLTMLFRMMTKSILWRLLFNAGVSFSTGFEAPWFDTISIWINGPVSIYHWRCFSAWWQNPFFDGCFSLLVWVFTLSLGRFRLIPFRPDLMVVSIYNWRCFSAWWQNPFFDGCFSMLVWVFPLALRRFRLIPFRSDLMMFLSIIDDAFPHDDKIHSLTVAFQCWCAFFPCLWGAFVWYHFDLTLWLCFYLSLKVFFRRMTTKSILWLLLFNAGVSFSTGFEALSFDTISIWLNGYVSIFHWRCSSAWLQNPFFDGCFSMLVWIFSLTLRRFRVIPYGCFFIYHWRCFSAWWQNPFFDGGFSMLVWVFPLALRRLRLIPLRSELMVLFLSIIEDASPHDDKIHSSTVAFQCWYEFFHWLWGAFVWYHFDLTQWFYFSIIEGVFPLDDKIHSLTVAFQCWCEFFHWLWGAFVWYHFDLN